MKKVGMCVGLVALFITCVVFANPFETIETLGLEAVERNNDPDEDLVQGFFVMSNLTPNATYQIEYKLDSGPWLTHTFIPSATTYVNTIAINSDYHGLHVLGYELRRWDSSIPGYRTVDGIYYDDADCEDDH